MKKNYVIDSCVFAQLLLEEKDSLRTKELVSKIIQENSYILVPSIFTYEIVGIFRKNKLPAEAIKTFTKHYYNRDYLKIINLDHEVINLALDIAEKGHNKSGFPSFYDSTYHALAILNKCNFITSDHRHYQKTKKLGNVELL